MDTSTSGAYEWRRDCDDPWPWRRVIVLRERRARDAAPGSEDDELSCSAVWSGISCVSARYVGSASAQSPDSAA